MYYWKSEMDFDRSDADFFRETGIETLYVRFFDLGWDEAHGAIPTAEFKTRNLYLKDLNVIPVIYIINETLEKTDYNDIPVLAGRMFEKIERMYSDYCKGGAIDEIQLDCDWTESTQSKYFTLIKEIRSKSEKLIISATIRLHQIKYSKKTGIPPADKGVLMYYNMGQIKSIKESNSILNNETGKQYMSEIRSYPLPLALALPAYSWGIWFRNNEFKGLVHNINEKTIGTLSFLEKTFKNYYKVSTDTVYEGIYFRNGDIIRLESITTEELENAAEICSPVFEKNEKEIIIYSYTPENSKLINEKDILDIYSMF